MTMEMQMRQEVTKHTPTPWALRSSGLIVGNINSNAVFVARLEHTDDQAWVDGSFAIRAVNNHDALVEEVKELRRMLSQFAPLAFKKETIPHLPGNLEAEVKEWLKSTRTEDVLSAAQEKS